MSPEDARAFELLEAVRAVAALWWTRREHTRLSEADQRQLGWRAARALEAAARREEELPPGFTWIVPDDDEVAAAVLPPVEPDPSLRLTRRVLELCFESRAVLLLHVVTGDLRHVEGPVAWMRERGWCVYPRRVEGFAAPRLSAARAGAWRVLAGDPPASLAFRRLCEEAWEAHLVASEWEPALDVEGGRHGRPVRSPSGKVYPLDEAVDVALVRGGFDLLGELARGEAAVDRVLTRLEKERQVERAARAMARAQKKASTRKAVPT